MLYKTDLPVYFNSHKDTIPYFKGKTPKAYSSTKIAQKIDNFGLKKKNLGYNESGTAKDSSSFSLGSMSSVSGMKRESSSNSIIVESNSSIGTRAEQPE